MQPKHYLPAGAILGLILGVCVSRGGGIILMLTLGSALGWLLSLVAREES